MLGLSLVSRSGRIGVLHRPHVGKFYAFYHYWRGIVAALQCSAFNGAAQNSRTTDERGG